MPSVNPPSILPGTEYVPSTDWFVEPVRRFLRQPKSLFANVKCQLRQALLSDGLKQTFFKELW